MQKESLGTRLTSRANCLMIFIVPAERRKANSGSQKCIASIGMFAFVCRQQNVLTKRGLITRRIKASQMLQSIVCAFRSIAGAATAEKLVLSHCGLQYKCDHQLTRKYSK